MSALMLLRGLSFSTRNICSSLSKEMKFPNQERFANLRERGWLEVGQEGAKGLNPSLLLLTSLPSQTHSGEDSGVKLDISSAVGTGGEGGKSMINTGPSLHPAHRTAVTSNQRFQTPRAHPPPSS